MNHKAMLACAVMLAACLPPGAAGQAPPVRVLEASVETTGGGAHFPGTAPGTLVVTGCPTCIDQSLRLVAETRYYIDGIEVSLAKLGAAALGSADRPMTVHFRLKDKVVTRVDLSTS